MEYTFEELKDKTVAELREIVKGMGNEAVQGYTQMNKEHLLVALCRVLNIDTRAHHEIKGLDKMTVKAKIRELKKKRDDALEAKDKDALKQVRRRIHGLKRKLRVSMT